MTAPYATISIPQTGQRGRLLVGDIIGRGQGATMTVEDPYVSVAHAMVDYRGGDLVLLALRKGFEVVGREGRMDAVRLVPGLQIRLAPSTIVHVDDVTLPPVLLTLVFGGATIDLVEVASATLMATAPHLVPNLQQGGLGHVWTDGERVMFRAGGVAIELHPGRPLVVEGLELGLIERPRRGGRSETLRERMIEVVPEGGFVQLRVSGGDALVLSGVAASLVLALIDRNGSIEVIEAASLAWEESWGARLVELANQERRVEHAERTLGRGSPLRADEVEALRQQLDAARAALEKPAKQAVYREVNRINRMVTRELGQGLLGCVSGWLRWAERVVVVT